MVCGLADEIYTFALKMITTTYG